MTTEWQYGEGFREYLVRRTARNRRLPRAKVRAMDEDELVNLNMAGRGTPCQCELCKAGLGVDDLDREIDDDDDEDYEDDVHAEA